MDGIAAAYVAKKLELHLTEDVELDEEAIKTTLATFKMKVNKVEKAESLPF